MYGKIFDSMYDGTLYGQWEALVTFQQLIVLCDADGIVDMTPPAIAARTSIPLEIITKGLTILESPDPYSRTPGQEGRRIELIDAHRPWGWHIVNHSKYQHMQDADTIRAQTRERVRKHREQKEQLRNGNAGVTDGNAQKRHTNTDTNTDTRTTLSGDARPMSWGFLAGIIDGEACVRLNRYEQNGSFTITPRLTIYNTNLALLEEIKSKIGMGSISGRERNNPNSKDLHELNFKRDEIAKIILGCSSHIVAKREQFSMLTDFLEHWPDDKAHCDELYERTKHLNARGKPDAKPNGNGKLHAEAVEILGVLNATAGRNYKPVKANLEMIEARLKEGATAEEIKAVIGRKCSQWGGDEKMAEYLRPATLFNRTKFAQYQGELGSSGRPEWMRDVI